MDILMALPDADFDPTESAIPWRILTDAGHNVLFATPSGHMGQCDDMTLTGKGLGVWRRMLAAGADAVQAYRDMANTRAFRRPHAFHELARMEVDALVLPGGHAPGMRPYLESPELQSWAVEHIGANKLTGTICHGILVLARAEDPSTGRSPLAGRRATALTAMMEHSGHWMTRLWLRDRFRTYPKTVQSEVEQAQGDKGLFEPGPLPVQKGDERRPDRGFVVRDGNLVSARWPGDAWSFATALRDALQS